MSYASATSNAAIKALPATALADALPDPVFLVDDNAAVQYANPAARSAFGQIPEGTLLPHKFRLPELQKLLQTSLKEKRSGTAEYLERVPIERAFRVFINPLGTPSDLFLVHFKDQSEARRIDRMRADFIANASHELRTPLASIAGFIETLRGPAKDDANARGAFLQIMQTQTERMARLIDDLLSLSRIEMKPHGKPQEKVDLGSIVTNVVQSLGHLANDYGVTINFQQPSEPILVPGARDELIQIFTNLLENACKYGQEGGRVDISFNDSRAGSIREKSVTVRDYGPGIAEEHIPRITERFYRIDAESSRIKNGTGLGLSIVKHILTRHDGRLTVRSKPGEGASFTVHLPVE